MVRFMTSIRVCKYLAGALLSLSLLAGTSIAFGQTVQLSDSVYGIDVGVRLDLLSVVLLAFLSSVVWLVAIYSARNLVGQFRTSRFGSLLMVASIALAVLVAGASLPVIALGWTVSGIALTGLVAHTGSPSALRASRYVGSRLLFSDVALWAGVISALILLPSTNRADLGDQPMPLAASVLVAGLLAVAAIARSGLFPMQGWLAETAEAPSPVSAFLHAGIVNGAGILGALMWPLFAAAPAVLAALVLVGLATVAAGTWSGRVRKDVKGQLANSTTAQMGYMTIQLGAGLPAAAILHLIGHGYYKAWLFLRAGGAVTRARQRPAYSVYAAELRSVRAVVAAATAVALTIALSAPSVLATATSLGITAVIPAVLALVTVAVAVAATARAPRFSLTAVAAVGAAAVATATAYLWVLLGWEHLMAQSLPQQAVWGPLVGSAIVALVLAGFGGVALGARQIARQPTGALAVRLVRTVLPPGAKRLHPGPALLDRASDSAADPVDDDTVEQLVRSAASLCAPAWPLRTFVAANPMAGLERFTFNDAASIAADYMGAQSYLPLRTYASLYDVGTISESALRASLADHTSGSGLNLDDSAITAWIDQLLSRAHEESEMLAHNTEGANRVSCEHAAIWCQQAWSSATDLATPGPWTLWRRAAQTRAYEKSVSVPGLAKRVAVLPEDATAALGALLSASGLPRAQWFNHVAGLLLQAPGWAAHAAWRARQVGTSEPLIELVALRAALDLIVNTEPTTVPTSAIPNSGFGTAVAQAGADRFGDQTVWQAALELSYRNPLLSQISQRASSPVSASATTASAQFVFCIDVRSGPIREQIEHANGSYQTYGFAGFFGAPIRYEQAPGIDFDQCPVLINPTVTIKEIPTSPRTREAMRVSLEAASTAPLTPLLIAEAGGAFFGLASALQTISTTRWNRFTSAWGARQARWGRQDLGHANHPEADSGLPVGLSVAAKTDLAASALSAIGLVDNFAPLLIICGHGSTTENNAYAAGYDCGACGGNAGTVNARVLAEAINHPDVRAHLALRGIHIPDETVAIAAVHDTTTDSIELDPEVARTAAMEALAEDLTRASERAVSRRLPNLPAHRSPGSAGSNVAAAKQRANDWAQPFPEWGLASNAVFIIGPRWLTSGINLDGRAFLHSYDPTLDSDNSTLNLLLTAPAVVTQWINSQYYFSTVDPDCFGAGDKTTHNVVGDVAVLTGAHGDLRTGLPWQAVFREQPGTGEAQLTHIPLRITIVVWAEQTAILDVLNANADVAQLFTNQWAHLVAIDPATGGAAELGHNLQWKPKDSAVPVHTTGT